MGQFNKELILQLADIVEQQPHAGQEGKPGFNMCATTHSCGAPSCIAGFAQAMTGKGHNWSLASIGEGLGLTALQSTYLFAPSQIDNWLAITPAEAAETLRKLAATGTVDWSHAAGYDKRLV